MNPDLAQDELALGLGTHEAARESVAALFRAHHLELVRLALVMTGDLATAEDVVQDAYERLHRGWHRVRHKQDSLAYARSIVLNACRSVHRHQAVAWRVHATLAPSPTWLADPAAGAADRSELATALRRLPPRQREVLALRYYCDLSVEQTAATLGIGPSAVRSTASRGLAALAQTLKGMRR